MADSEEERKLTALTKTAHVFADSTGPKDAALLGGTADAAIQYAT